ncbi:MAG: DUF465 domain-containing protein [Desulfovibrio sp.]|nr:DUF465 domain-containing protein [Desulfovibrio sp.]
MEQRDLELIETLVATDEELAKLWANHRQLDNQIENMSARLYLTSEEQVERKRLQKLKLAGRDRIEAILAAHRAQGR